MDTTELPDLKKIAELNNEIDIFCLTALRNMNLKQITIDFLEQVTTDLVWEFDLTSDDVGAFGYHIDVVMEVMNTKEFAVDYDILLILSSKLHLLNSELRKIKSK